MNALQLRLFLLLFFLMQFKAQSQENNGLPKLVNLLQHAEIKTSGMFSLSDAFYPVGWSENGMFAYIISPSYEDLRAEGRTLDFYVFNAVSDEIVFHERIDTYDYADGIRICESDNNDMLCAWRDVQYDTVLQYYQIKQQTEFLLNPVSFEILGESFQIEIINGDLCIHSSLKGTKKITSNFSHNAVLGYLMSPYELRIIVVAGDAAIEKGAEGPDATYTRIYYNFYGCHLQKGFKKLNK